MSKLSPLILIIISVGVFFYFIDPERIEYAKLSEIKIENEKRLEDVKTLEKEFFVLQEKYKKISDEEKEKLNKVLPETVDNVRLILDINNIADNYGIVIRNISVTGGPIGEDQEDAKNAVRSVSENGSSSYGVISLGFSVVATYDVFKSFMQDLETSLRIVDITDFSVSTGEGEFYNYSVKLNTYWLR